MNQGPRGYSLMKKNRGSKISWHCPFKSFCGSGSAFHDFVVRIHFPIELQCWIRIRIEVNQSGFTTFAVSNDIYSTKYGTLRYLLWLDLSDLTCNSWKVLEFCAIASFTLETNIHSILSILLSFLVVKTTLMGVWKEHSPLSLLAILKGGIVYKYTSLWDKYNHTSKKTGICDYQCEKFNQASVADPDPVLFYPLDPGSGSGMNFFRIPDPRGMFLVRFS
jgi:hypothetical protein